MPQSLSSRLLRLRLYPPPSVKWLLCVRATEQSSEKKKRCAVDCTGCSRLQETDRPHIPSIRRLQENFWHRSSGRLGTPDNCTPLPKAAAYYKARDSRTY